MEDRLVLLALRLKACSIDSILEVTLNKWNKPQKSFVCNALTSSFIAFENLDALGTETYGTLPWQL